MKKTSKYEVAEQVYNEWKRWLFSQKKVYIFETWLEHKLKEKTMKRYEAALILFCAMVASFTILLCVDIYQDQPKKMQTDPLVQARLDNENRAIRDGLYTTVPSLDEQLNYAVATQSAKAQCSSYINTNCEGYHPPVCERE